ncbi:MAG: protein pyrBI [Lachnospiraceae bacterium]|nr:protein pyrBI [Lachnospiraceae bacterium]
MKRITSACLEQTIRFFDATGTIRPEDELEQYKKKLDRKNTRYEILETSKESDGSIIIKIKKQYNTYSTEGYL